MTKIITALVAACLAATCSNPAVSKAIGTGADGSTPIVVRTSESAVIVENHTGRALLNVRITITTETTVRIESRPSPPIVSQVESRSMLPMKSPR